MHPQFVIDAWTVPVPEYASVAVLIQQDIVAIVRIL
jgi:hypothetical protein